MPQDFDRRISIVVDRNLPIWQVLNTVGHISAYFGHKMNQPFDTGEYFITQDGINLPRNTQYPIVILAATDSEQLKKLAQDVREESDVQGMFFIKEMVETSNDIEIVTRVGVQKVADITYLGVGLFGENDYVKILTSGFKLWS